MSNDPAFLFYPGDYLRDTQCLSESVQVAYDRIMCEHMRNICISQAQLNFFTKRLSADEKAELEMVLTKIDGGFQIKWIAESIVKRKAYSESRRANRTKKDEKPKPNTSTTYDEHMENENVNEDESKEEKENKKPKPAKTDLQFLIDRFNEKCDKLPKVKALSDTRKTALKNRIDEYGIEQIEVVFELVSESNFLNGENNTGFTASIDWVLKPQNFIKILEGNYKNKPNGNRTNNPQRTEADRKQSALAAAASMRGFRQPD